MDVDFKENFLVGGPWDDFDANIKNS